MAERDRGGAPQGSARLTRIARTVAIGSFNLTRDRRGEAGGIVGPADGNRRRERSRSVLPDRSRMERKERKGRDQSNAGHRFDTSVELQVYCPTEVRGLSPLSNVRIRGKIPRDEWPKIASRFQKGETLTEIARSYGCTAPAIRYIVARTSPGGTRPKMNRDRSEKGTLLAPPAESRRTTRIGPKEDRINRSRVGSSSSSEAGDVWGRINTDITMFLAAMDTLSSDESVGNYEALLAATDRLLWATARTRLELERILADRGKTSLRRLSN